MDWRYLMGRGVFVPAFKPAVGFAASALLCSLGCSDRSFNTSPVNVPPTAEPPVDSPSQGQGGVQTGAGGPSTAPVSPPVGTSGARATGGSGSGGASGGAPSVDAAVPENPRKPNILIILADDMGSGDIGAYNSESKVPTPVLDALAARGMRFTDAHSPSSVCTPTRYSLLTGRYAWRSRLKSGVLAGYDRALIENGRETLASMLSRSGYATSIVGKWHLGLGAAEKTDYAAPLVPGPNAVGFDYFFGIPASLDMPPYVYVENDAVVAPPAEQIAGSGPRRTGGNGYWRAGPVAPGFSHQDVLPELTTRAVEQVEKLSQGGKPFFLYVPLSAPHTPWLPSPEFAGKSGAGHYGDFVAQVDGSVGTILAALEDSGAADDTLVIFASDNGAHWKQEDIATYGHLANSNWRGQKADIFEAGHRVPVIASWPGQVPASSSSDEFILLTDLMATLANVANAEYQGGEDSHDFIAALLNQPGNASFRETGVLHSLSGMFALREGDWKLIEGLGSGGFTVPKTIAPEAGGPTGQLYDLAADPQETNNLYLERPDIVARMQSLLDGIRAAN